MKIRQHIDIPDNIAEYAGGHNCNLSININSTDGVNGYGIIEHFTVHISLHNRICGNCGYNELFRPDLWDHTKCVRHRYGIERYDDVFVWSERSELSLEEAFDSWLQAQPRSPDEPVKVMIFGKP